MAFFKFRKAAEEPAAAPPASSIDELRKSARRRLMGAVILVLAALIAFPLLFDSQPRPVAVDVPISIPDRDKVKPLVTPAPVTQASETLAATPSPAAGTNITSSASGTQTPSTATTLTPSAVLASGSASQPNAPASQAVSAASMASAAAAVSTTAASTNSAKSGDAARARALLEGLPDPAQPASSRASAPEQIRIVLQVGAFADAAKVRDVRRKLEKSGLKTYTQVMETSEGKRIRVRLGPYTDRSRADKDAEKIKALDLPVTYLSL